MTDEGRRRTDLEWRVRNVVRSRFPRLTALYRRHGSFLVARDRRHPRFSRWARRGAGIRRNLGTHGIVFDESGIWIRDEHGLEWFYDPDIWLSALGKELGVAYDVTEITHIHGRLQRGGAFVDVGAHVGGYSLPVAQWNADVQIHAFEPVPATRALLERNLARNSLRDRVTVWPYALSDHAGKHWISTSFGGANHLVDSRGARPDVTEVDVTSLDHLLLETCSRVDVVKCDIEGAELEALRGAEHLLRRDRPDLVVEFDSDLARRSGQNPLELLEYLSGLGYRSAPFTDPAGTVDPEAAARSSPARNVLFVADRR